MNTAIPVGITDADAICLMSVEDYMHRAKMPMSSNPQEMLSVKEHTRNVLYSEIANRLPRIAGAILNSSMDNDKIKGLFLALQNHCMDKAFTDIVLQRLRVANATAEDRHIVGALFITVCDKYFEKHKPSGKIKPDEEKKQIEEIVAKISHIKTAATSLLADIAADITARCPGLTEVEATAVAAAIACNNESTITELMNFPKEITADIFNIYGTSNDLTRIITHALLMKKADYLKTNETQKAFVESLKRFVFDKLDRLPMPTMHQFITSTYQTLKPELSAYLICISDASMSTYPNLHAVAKELK